MVNLPARDLPAGDPGLIPRRRSWLPPDNGHWILAQRIPWIEGPGELVCGMAVLDHTERLTLSLFSC